MKKIKMARQLFGLATVFIALTYFLYIWQTSPVNLLLYIKSIKTDVFMSAITLSTMAGLLNATVWFKINQKLDRSIAFSNTYRAWSVGRIYRYIPGKVAGYYIRHKLQKSSIKLGFAASVNEFILQILPVLFLTLFYLITIGRNTFIIIICIAILFLCFIKPLAKFLYTFSTLSSSFIHNILSPREMTINCIFIFPAMLLHGISFFLILNSGVEKDSISLFQAIIAFYISGLLGQLALIAPGGIGVREAAIVVVLSSFGVDNHVAISTAIISRVILLLSELCNVFLSFILMRVK